MDDKDDRQTLDSLTYIDSAEGMARRVLNDLEKSGLAGVNIQNRIPARRL